MTQLFWQALHTTGLEHCSLDIYNSAIRADGLVIGVENDVPFRVRYRLSIDERWHVTSVLVSDLTGAGADVYLISNGEGAWFDKVGKPVPALDGCIDVDIAVTPFTNMLPIRRLNLAVGEMREIAVTYIQPTENMHISRVMQQYSCVSDAETQSVYRFTQADFSADITVDQYGLVITYPGLFQRVNP
jgi:hypothetical protein